MIATMQVEICAVCRLLDFDTTKKLCGFCPLCDSWICEADQNRWDRRLRAAIRRRLEPGFSGDPTYADKLNEKGELK